MATAPGRSRRTGPRSDERGQGLVEYALILVLIALVAIAALAFFGTAVSGYLSSIGTSI